jgi:hypothetical protein
MRGARALVVVALFPCAVAFAQTVRPTASVATSVSLIVPADSHTETSYGGSFEFDYLVSRSFSLGVAAGLWKGGSDFGKDSEARYFVGVAIYRWGVGRVRPFLQLGGGVYRVKFQFPERNRFAPLETDTVGGGFGGIGLDYRLSTSSALEVGTRYHLVSDVSGVHTDFLETQLGVRFFF